MPECSPSLPCAPAGGVFDPLNLASDDSERTSKLREAEIKHARLAMVSFLGYAVQVGAAPPGPPVCCMKGGACKP